MSAAATNGSEAKGVPVTSGDRIGTLVFLACVTIIAITSIILSLSFPATPLPTDVGPARFPNLFAVCLIVLCLAQAYITATAPAAVNADRDPETGELKPQPNYLRVFIGVLSTIICVYAMGYLGFEICAIVYLFVLMRLMGRKKYLWNAIFAVLLSASIYLVFSNGLNVPLPEITLFDM